MTETKTKTKLKELGSSKSSYRADTGKFRAIVILDLILHQIGEDTPDRNVAFGYCEEYQNEMFVQIFDDQGQCHIVDGKLKKI